MDDRAFDIRPGSPSDWHAWLRMSQSLFPEESRESLESGMRSFSARADAQVFLAFRPDGTACGFIEAGSRSIADGCDSSPVAYVEAWYVDPDMRRRAIGGALLDAAQNWARHSGCAEIASDVLIDNETSAEAHRRHGFEEVSRVITFRKSL